MVLPVPAILLDGGCALLIAAAVAILAFVLALATAFLAVGLALAVGLVLVVGLALVSGFAVAFFLGFIAADDFGGMAGRICDCSARVQSFRV